MDCNNLLGVLKLQRIIWICFYTTIHYNMVTCKIGYFWHITDLHLDSFYSTKGDIHKSCWHFEHRQTNTQMHMPGRYGDYLCDSPWSLLESATQAMKSRQGDNVEFVLWTGDGLSHASRRVHETSRMDLLRNITELMGRTFSSQFVFPVVGHEDGQMNNFHRLSELWRHWLPSEAVQTFEKGGYYVIEQSKSRLRIIVLNTNYMRHDIKYLQVHSSSVRQRASDSTEKNNFHFKHEHQYRESNFDYDSTLLKDSISPNGGSINSVYRQNGETIFEHSDGGTVSALSGSENHESQKQWDWLEDVLAKSNRNKETVYIVGHIPPGSDERQIGTVTNGHTTFSEKNNLRYIRLVRKYASIIKGQFFGHLHSDSFRIVYSELGKPVSWMMIAPSVTPRKMNVGANNPAMRLYKFETDTGQVLDYTQYYLDLSLANINGEAVWQPEYNLTSHYYGLGEVTAVALHNLADRFTNTENPLFAKYYRANSVRYPTPSCEGVCALQHYCAITRVDYQEFRQCLETAASALASSSNSCGQRTSQLLFMLSIFISALQYYKQNIVMHEFNQRILTAFKVILLFIYNLCLSLTTKHFLRFILYKSTNFSDLLHKLMKHKFKMFFLKNSLSFVELEIRKKPCRNRFKSSFKKLVTKFQHYVLLSFLYCTLY